MNSKAQVKGKLGHVLQIHICCLLFAVNVTLNLFIGGNLPRNINKEISLFALKRKCDHASSHRSDSGTI